MRKPPTQAEVADYFGLTDRTLRNWKNGSIEEQRRYYALTRYYDEMHRGWTIDYDTNIATHPHMIVEILPEPVEQRIGDRVVVLGFGSNGHEYGVKMKKIDSGFWRENLDQGGKPLAKAMRELGGLFEPGKWEVP